MGCSGVRSRIGYCVGGSTRPISSVHCTHASGPQKSSTHTNPPFNRYARSASTSASLSSIVPTSSICTNGHEIRLLLCVELDADLRQLRQADREVDVGIRIVGRPPGAAGLTTVAGVDAAT